MPERGMVLFGLFWTVALPVLGFFVTEAALADLDMAGFPPPGRLVVVDGHQHHLFCTGAGTPTVVLEEGAGGASLNWVWVQRMVAATTRICSYDRPGYAWSDPSDTPRDAETVGRELDALLKSTGEKGPFIVVGHSLGGAYARMFAAQRRDEVVSLVLVDATSPSAFATMSEVGLPPIRKSAFVTFLASSGALFQFAHRIGLIRFAVDETVNDFPSDAVPAMRVFLLSPERARTAVRELNFVSDTLHQISPLGGLGPMPVTIIAADRWIDKDPAVAAKRAEWNKKQQRNWLAISTNSRYLVVPGSDHLSLLSKKEHAAERRCILQPGKNIIARVISGTSSGSQSTSMACFTAPISAIRRKTFGSSKASIIRSELRANSGRYFLTTNRRLLKLREALVGMGQHSRR